MRNKKQTRQAAPVKRVENGVKAMSGPKTVGWANNCQRNANKGGVKVPRTS